MYTYRALTASLVTRAMINEGLTAQSGQLIRIIILVTYHINEAACAAVRAGASGIVLTEAAPTELVDAIRAVIAGEVWLDPAVTRRLIDEFICLDLSRTSWIGEDTWLFGNGK